MEKSSAKPTPNILLMKQTFLYFLTGALFFAGAMAAAFAFLPGLLSDGAWRNPQGWMLAHMLMLGWATTVAMAASFQITQVLLRTRIYSKSLGYAQIALHTVGLALLLAGLSTGTVWIAAGGTLVAAGAVLYGWNLAATYIKKRTWNVFVFGVALSLLALYATIAFGILMGLSFAFGWNAGVYEQIFRSHLWAGLGGWMSGLILVFSFKLLPMFYVSKRRLTRSAYAIIGGYHAGLWLRIAAIWPGTGAASGWLTGLSQAVMAASLIAFLLYGRDVVRMSLKLSYQPAGAVRIPYYLNAVVFASFVGWNAVQWLRPGWGSPEMAAILILGWFTPSILAYLSKIVPFLWWPRRYDTPQRRKDARPLAKMVNENRITLELLGYLAGIAAVLVGMLSRHPTVGLVGLGFAAVCLVAYSVDLTRAFRV